MGYKEPPQNQHTRPTGVASSILGREGATSKRRRRDSPESVGGKMRASTSWPPTRKARRSKTAATPLRMTSLRLWTNLTAGRGILGLAGAAEFGALFVPVKHGFADAVHGLLRHQTRAL